MIRKETLTFLSDLSANNSSLWMKENSDRYKASIMDFRLFTRGIIEGISGFDDDIRPAMENARDCIPKMNRDLRFTSDKVPYKPYLYAIICRNGRKSGHAGYHLFLKPGECRIVSGDFQPTRARLKVLREEIYYNYDQWESIIRDRALLECFPEGVVAQKHLKRPPLGFADEPGITEFLKMQGFFVRKHLSNNFLTSNHAIRDIVADLRTSLSLVKFLNQVDIG